MKKIKFIAIIVMIICGCKGDVGMYKYYDGSGNGYILSGGQEKSLEYEPVKPEMSSSGIYDGGEPVKIILTGSQYETAANLLEKALKNRSVHIEKRLMGSGMIKLGDRTVILAPGSQEQKQIEAALKGCLP